MEENDKKKSATQIVKEIKRRTCGKFTAEEKIKIVLEGMRGEDTIAAICRKYAIHQNNYFKWLKEFIEAVKRRLSGDTLREATRDEVTDLGRMNDLLKRALGEMYVENKELKKTHDWLRVRRIIKLKKYMRLSQDEKIEIINLVENSDLSANR
ncbi:MAG: transposase, partial [Bacteroidales bacterium]|nr:transposase [Bacteroidales bacterium]